MMLIGLCISIMFAIAGIVSMAFILLGVGYVLHHLIWG